MNKYSCSRLKAQGFACGTEEDFLFYSVRITPAVSILIILLGLILKSPYIVGVMAIVAIMGVLLPRGMPIDAAYNLVAHAFNKPPLPPTPTPRRFSYAISAVLLAFSSFALFFGYTSLGRFLGGLVIIGGAVLATSLFCLGSWIYWNIQHFLKK